MSLARLTSLLIGLAFFSHSSPVTAAARCLPFVGFPLVINMGTGPDTGTGESIFCFGNKVQAAFGMLGQPNGIASLDVSGRIPVAQAPTRVQTMSLIGVGDLNTTYASTPNPNAVVFGSGNSVSFAPALSTVLSPSPDHQRASALFSAQTQDDGHSQEQTVGITTTIKTGFYKPWIPNTAYAVGDNVQFQDARNAVYRAVQAGTSATSGTGPSGKTAGIVDGTVRRDWINDAAINAKVGLYNEVEAVAGGGNGWAQANNFHMKAGYVPRFAVNTELDFTNDTGIDCVPGLVAGCNNLYLRTYGANKSTSSINVEGPSTGNAAAYFGAYFHGSKLASDATLQIDTNGAYGIRFGGFGTASYAQAAIYDTSNAPSGIVLAGTYNTAQISGPGWRIDPTGNALLPNVTVNGNVYEPTPFVPPTSTTACTVGQRAWDANWEYRCVAANTWKRAALSAW